jgi:hypothetical protein
MRPWGIEDVRIVGDIVIGSLLANGLRLIVVKAFIEPTAVYLGRKAYRQADKALGGALPDWIPPNDQ